MAVFKCKMCGGDLDVQEGLNVCECEYCGTKQTIPALDNEKKLNLFNRANRLRLNSEFDKAATIYENIIAEFPEEAEGYWGLVLCNYGIEYVDDPATAKKIPTCHRAAFDSITKDENYNLALEYADVVAQKLYRDEAREIDRIMSEILSISKNEKPYDIFICYKETDEIGNRTIDSVIAQDVYDALTDKGYRVFFSRISLEDKLGQQYEPYIFAALNSAKVMLTFGTKYEYYHAVWVKNEWSRFLKLMAKDKTKALVPCYKDLDAYDMPDEFKALQAQDMGKVGAIQDLIRGIDKLLPKNESTIVQEAIIVNNTTTTTATVTTDSLIKRAFMFLEDGEWDSANAYCEKVLDIDPENAQAYLGKLMVDLRINNQIGFIDCLVDFSNNKNYKKIIAFGSDDMVTEMQSKLIKIQNAIEEKKRLKIEAELERKRLEEKLYQATELQKFVIESDVLKNYLGSDVDVLVTARVSSIGKECFKSDTIKTISIPSSVTKIDKAAFDKCTNLGAINVSEENSFFTSVDGVLFNKNKTRLIKYPINKTDVEYTVPETVTVIDEFAFADCTKLVSITIPNSVTKINARAFGKCTNLKYVKLPDGLNTIADGVFYGCSKLSGIRIPEGVISIGNSAFLCCTSLISVAIPKSVEVIGSGAFNGCSSLATVTFFGENIRINDGAFIGTPYKDNESIKNKRSLQERYRVRGLCQYCGGSFSGLFVKKCTKCGRSKDY